MEGMSVRPDPVKMSQLITDHRQGVSDRILKLFSFFWH
jgi:hypothetical protein